MHVAAPCAPEPTHSLLHCAGERNLGGNATKTAALPTMRRDRVPQCCAIFLKHRHLFWDAAAVVQIERCDDVQALGRTRRFSFQIDPIGSSHINIIRYILFHSILFYSILFYSILFYSILFYSILFYSIPLYYILSYSSILYVHTDTYVYTHTYICIYT